MACNKVDQKIRNLERSYKDFVQYVKKTGEGKKSPPEFYEELSALYGQKHTIHPVALVDSLLDTSTENAGILSPRPSTSKSDTEDTCTSPIEEITKPQKKKIKRTHAKKNVNGDIVSFLMSMKEEQRNLNASVQKMTEAFEKSQEQEKEYLNELKSMHKEKLKMHKALIDAFSGKKKKHNTKHSSDDDDDSD